MIKWLQKVFKKQKFDNTRRLNMIVAKIGDRLIDSDTLAELEYRQLMGVYHAEQAEAHAASCCVALGVDPASESEERDICNEIVFHRENPMVVIRALQRIHEDCK